MIFNNVSYELEGVSGVLITWNVSMFEQLGLFKIFKSNDGYTFMDIATIYPGTIGQTYVYRDLDVVPKYIYYYVLKAYDKSGTPVLLEETQPYEIKVSNILVNGTVQERGSNAPMGNTTIHVENVVTGEQEVIITDPEGQFNYSMLFGNYKFYINDIPGYDIVEETIKLDTDAVRYRAAVRSPKAIIDEDLTYFMGVNSDILSPIDPLILPTVFRTVKKNLSTRFAQKAVPTVGEINKFNSGSVCFVLSGTESKIQNIDADNGLIIFDKAPKEYLYKTVTVGNTADGLDRVTVADAVNLKPGNIIYFGYRDDAYYAIRDINYEENTLILDREVYYIEEGTDVRPSILLTYYALEFPNELSVAMNFYLIRSTTALYLNNMRTLVPSSFWNMTLPDTNFNKILQMYAEQFADYDDASTAVKWNNYLYDSVRRDSEFIPPANVGIAPFHEVDRDSIYNNFGVYVGRDIKPTDNIDTYRRFIRSVWRVLLLGPTGDAHINSEIAIASAVGGERFINTEFSPLVENICVVTKNSTGLGMGQIIGENLKDNNVNVNGTQYNFNLGHSMLLNIYGLPASVEDVVVVGTTSKLAAVDPVNGVIYFRDPPSLAELNDGIVVSYWYDNKTVLILGSDYHVDWEAGQVELFTPLAAGDKVELSYIRRSAMREAVKIFMEDEKAKHSNLKYSIDNKEFFVYNNTQPELIKRRSFTYSDGYSRFSTLDTNSEGGYKLIAHPQMVYTNSYFELIVNVSDNFDFRNQIGETLVHKYSNGGLRGRITDKPMVPGSLKVELVSDTSGRSTFPGYLIENTDYTFVNNVNLNSDDFVVEVTGENILRNGMGNNVNGDSYFVLRHKNIRNYRGQTREEAILDGRANLLTDFIKVTGTEAKIADLNIDTGELLFEIPVTQNELLSGVTVSYWYDYREEFYENVRSDNFNLVEILLEGGVRDDEEILAYYYEIGRGLSNKDTEIKWLVDIAKPATTFYDLVFSIRVDVPYSKFGGYDGEKIDISRYVQEEPNFAEFRYFLFSDINSLTNLEMLHKNRRLSDLARDIYYTNRFYLGDSIVVNRYGLAASKEDIFVSHGVLLNIDYYNGWIEFVETPDIYTTSVQYYHASNRPALIGGGMIN